MIDTRKGIQQTIQPDNNLHLHKSKKEYSTISDTWK